MVEQLHLLFLLAWHFMVLSLFAVGGGPSMLLPQIRYEFVDQFHFFTNRGFTEILAVAQAAPGPNFLLMPLIGFRAASWPGAIVSVIGFIICPVTITFFVGRLLHQHDNEWVARLRRAFRPVTGGLWVASGVVIAATTDRGVTAVAITVAVAVISLIADVSPIWLFIGAAAAGAIFV